MLAPALVLANIFIAATVAADCSSPTVIPAAGGTVTGTTSGASTLVGTCEPGPTSGAPEAVFQWTPAVSGTATIETCSATATTFDTVLYVRGVSCTDGPELACNDDTPGCGTTRDPGDPHLGSRLTLLVEAGQTYFIVLDGFAGSSGGSTGSFSLTVTEPVPTTTSTTETTTTTSSTTTTLAPTCTSPTVIPPTGGTVTGATGGASILTGTCEPGPTSGAPEAVFQWTPAVSGTATVETCSGTATTFDTVLYVRGVSCTDGPELACNDDTVGCGTTRDPGDPHLGSRVTLAVEAGQTYFIVVDGFAGSSGGSAGSFSLTVTPPVPTTTSTTQTTITSSTTTATAPTTTSTTSTTETTTSTTETTTSSSTTTTLAPSCGSPAVIPPAGGTVTGATGGASNLTGTCEPGPTGGAPETVFEWTPEVSGTATIETCSATATTFDTVLYVRGASCTDGAELACNDDTTGCGTTTDLANPHLGSRVTLAVEAGQTYFIVVDGFAGSGGGSAGSFSLTVTPPVPVPTTTTSTSTTQRTTTSSSSSTSTTRATTTSTTLRPGMVCGDLVSDPCVVNLDVPRRVFGSLQRAIDAAADGATITVTGLCTGPVKVNGRSNLTIQGVAPPSGCGAAGPGPADLTSTIRGGRDLIRLSNSSNIVLRFLNIVDAELSGVKIQRGHDSVVHCNCIARNGRAGVRVDDSRGQEISQNLVTLNGRDGITLDECRENTIRDNTSLQNSSDGIALEDSKKNLISGNVVRRNGDSGINLDEADSNRLASIDQRVLNTGDDDDGNDDDDDDGKGARNEGNTVGENLCEDNRGDGIRLEEGDKNTVAGNTVRRNAEDGIHLDEADKNRVTDNEVVDNGTDPAKDSGIELVKSKKNFVDGNVIRNNADGLIDKIRCRSGSKKNSGSNVVSRCQ